jgi:polysaccharide chain length determinant protein (PEP-CTERM system associated)
MHAAVAEALEHVRGIWRFRRTAVLSAWAAAVIGWTAVLVWPDSYEATARVFVNTSTPLRPLLQGLAIDPDIDAQLTMVRESLLGRPRLERVAREADLDLKVKTPEDLDRLIAVLQTSIQIEATSPRVGGRDTRSPDSIYTITYRNSSRDKALTVVRSLLNALMDDTMSGKRLGADSAERFLAEQIKEYEKRLSDAEGRLAEFKRRNVGLVPGQQGDYFSRLQNVMVEEKKAESALELAQQRRAELERQLRDEKPLSRAGAAPTSGLAAARGAAVASGGNDTASRVADAQAKLDELLLRFTDKHPDVIAARETLEQLKARQQAELDALKRGDPAAAAITGLAANPVYQNIQLQLNQTDVEIASLRADVVNQQRTETELKRMLNTAPEVEAEFQRLTRDYDVEKAQYNALVDRLEKAKLSEGAAGTGIVQFQVTNPPTSDLQPVAPRRPLILSVVLVTSVGVGVLVAWLLSQVRPVFNNLRSLADFTGFPVLGSVSRVWIERHREHVHRSLYKLVGASAALLIAFGAVLALYEPGSRWMHKLVGL